MAECFLEIMLHACCRGMGNKTYKSFQYAEETFIFIINAMLCVETMIQSMINIYL